VIVFQKLQGRLIDIENPAIWRDIVGRERYLFEVLFKLGALLLAQYFNLGEPLLQQLHFVV
jgi:hypothetical protein